MLLNGRNNALLFDVVIDPFYDLYLNGVIDHINFNGRYVFCGHCEQYANVENLKFLFSENYKSIFKKCMLKNISMIGNCLGLRSDLEAAIGDYSDNKYDVLIDSIYSGINIIPFLERSYKDSSRVGKVVYQYDN